VNKRHFGRNTIRDASIACKRKTRVLSLNKKATREKYIYSLFMILEPYVGTPPRRRTFENDFHKTKPGQRLVSYLRTKAYCSMKTCFIFEIKKINQTCLKTSISY
jgi:hypothetical protein